MTMRSRGTFLENSPPAPLLSRWHYEVTGLSLSCVLMCLSSSIFSSLFSNCQKVTPAARNGAPQDRVHAYFEIMIICSSYHAHCLDIFFFALKSLLFSIRTVHFTLSLLANFYFFLLCNFFMFSCLVTAHRFRTLKFLFVIYTFILLRLSFT